MEFVIRDAKEEDLHSIMQIMNQTEQGGTPSEWYVTDSEEVVRKEIQGEDIVLVAETDHTVAGFFIAKYPDMESNLGTFLGYTQEQLGKVVIMDSAAVAPQFQGNGLQGKMLEEIEKRIDWTKYQYSMCTVHPENCYSLHNMQKHGYEVKKTVRCYGNHIRHILVAERSKKTNEQNFL